MPKIGFKNSDVEALIEALALSEKVKPFQVAKRTIFERYGILGSRKDRILTAIIYSIYRLQGILDKAVDHALGARPLDYNNDPLLRQALRLSAYLAQFDKVKDPELEAIFLRHGLKYLATKIGWRKARLVYRVFKRLRRNPWKPSNKLEEYELTYKVPGFLIASLSRILDTNELRNLLEYINKKPIYSIRVNTLKASPAEVLEYLRNKGVKAWRSARLETIIFYEEGFTEAIKELVEKGLAVPQDEASAYASILLDPRPGETIVDLCAAPGGKATHLAELSRNKARIIAFDIYHDRMKRLVELAEKTETIVSIEPVLADGRIAYQLLGENKADKVLVDPPCSSTGALAKHPDARWRLNLDGLGRLISVQRSLLVSGLRVLRPGGLLLYTTCSLLPEENEENIKWLLGEYAGRIEIVELKGPYEESRLLKGAMRAWPHKHKTIGFYYTLIRKKK
ncbi:MAG: RsmB/NOP family class I SAM-dependent RNA methyltransferase [Pyrodictiaceae archaeon]